MGKLKYIDRRPEFFPAGSLEFYHGGLVLTGGEEIKVTDDEKRILLKRKNGKNACYEIIRERAVKEDQE